MKSIFEKYLVTITNDSYYVQLFVTPVAFSEFRMLSNFVLIPKL